MCKNRDARRHIVMRIVLGKLSSPDNKYPITRVLNFSSVHQPTLKVTLRAEMESGEFFVFEHRVDLDANPFTTETSALIGRLYWFTTNTGEERKNKLAEYWYIRHATHKRDVYPDRLVCEDCGIELTAESDGFSTHNKHSVDLVREPGHPDIQWGKPIAYDVSVVITHTSDFDARFLWSAYLGNDPEAIFLGDEDFVKSVDDAFVDPSSIITTNVHDRITGHFIRDDTARQSVREAEQKWWSKRREEKEHADVSFARAWGRALKRSHRLYK